MYQDYTKSEKKVLNKYGIDGCTENSLLTKTITETVKHYAKNGTKWMETESKTAVIPCEYYCNVVSAIQFFRNLGGTESVTRAYTFAGYIPTKIISTSPDKMQRTIRTYSISLK